jgi:hypothetical protein
MSGNKVEQLTDPSDTYQLLGTCTMPGSINMSGTFQIGGTTVTSTAAELNILDGVTSTAAELNKLDGVTSTTAELNMLDDSANSVTIAYATGTGTDDIDVTLTVTDAAGATIDAVHKLEVFITDDDIGGVLTSTAASGALTATTGAILTALTAKKHVTMTTAATGIGALNLVDSANTAGERFCVVNPFNGKVIVGASTVATDYEGGV